MSKQQDLFPPNGGNATFTLKGTIVYPDKTNSMAKPTSQDSVSVENDIWHFATYDSTPSPIPEDAFVTFYECDSNIWIPQDIVIGSQKYSCDDVPQYDLLGVPEDTDSYFLCLDLINGKYYIDDIIFHDLQVTSNGTATLFLEVEFDVDCIDANQLINNISNSRVAFLQGRDLIINGTPYRVSAEEMYTIDLLRAIYAVKIEMYYEQWRRTT